MAVGFAALRRSVWQLPWLLGWLAFLPNSVYLVTDLSHLGEGGVELWRHVLQYGFAAWTGIMLGVVSLRLIHTRTERDYGVVFGWMLVVASIGLCAIGVVIGRFQRWNSWDLVTQPKAVVATTLEWVRSPFLYHQSRRDRAEKALDLDQDASAPALGDRATRRSIYHRHHKSCPAARKVRCFAK